MDESTVQVVTAVLAVGGTLAAAVLTQRSNRASEHQRRTADDRARWLQERMRIGSAVLARSLKLERRLWDVCSMLDRNPRRERMAGYTSILLTPEDGVDGVFDEITRAILVEGVEESFAALDDLEELIAQMAIIGSVSDATTARTLHERLWDVAGLLESYAPFDDAADAVEKCRTARDEFMKSIRVSLRAGNGFAQPDRRPRA